VPTDAARGGQDPSPTCAAAIYVEAAGPTGVVLEVWDTNGNRRFGAVRTVNGNGNQQVTTGEFPFYQDHQLQFRIVMQGRGDGGPNFVRLDDLVFQCYS